MAAKDDKVRQHPDDPQIDPHIFDNLSTDRPFSWLTEPRVGSEEWVRQHAERQRLKGEKHDGPPAPLPKERPPHIKPEWEAKLPEWEAKMRKGDVPKDPDFMAYMWEREKQLRQDPERERRIQQRVEELRARINELRSGVPEEAM